MIYKSNIYYFLNDEFYCDYKGSDTFSVSLSDEFKHFIFLFFLSNRLYLFTNKNIYIKCECQPEVCMELKDYISKYYQNKIRMYLYKKQM